MPKLTSLTTEGKYSGTFHSPRSIILEGISFHSILTNRHVLSQDCYSKREVCFQGEENRPYQESLFLLSLNSRHHFCSPALSPFQCFFHIQPPSVSIPIITSPSLLSPQINTPAVQSISTITNIAIELSPLPQLHLHISSTSNGISKPSITQQTSTRAKQLHSLVNRHSLYYSPKHPLYQRNDNTHQHQPPIHPPIPPSPHPSPFLHSPSPQVHPHPPLFKSPLFPQSTTIHQQTHPNPHHPSPPLHLPSTTPPSHPQRWGFPISPPPLPHPFPPRGSPQEQALLRFSRYGRGSFSPIQFHFPVHSLISL